MLLENNQGMFEDNGEVQREAIITGEEMYGDAIIACSPPRSAPTPFPNPMSDTPAQAPESPIDAAKPLPVVANVQPTQQRPSRERHRSPPKRRIPGFFN
jgi:hypothetical protein